VLKALTQYHEATGDLRIPPAMGRLFRRLDALLADRPLRSWARYRWGDLLLSVHWLFDRTGEPWLLDLAARVADQGFSWRQHFKHFPYWDRVHPIERDQSTHGVNVAMGLKKEGKLSPSEISARVTEALELVDLPNVENKFPAELSGGMRKRVGIARAIARRPKYLLYDEPTTGLDPVTSAVIDELMIRLREKLGVTSIVITHDMNSAYKVGSRIAMLYEGKVRQVGTVEEIRHTKDPIVCQFIEGRPDVDSVTTGV